MSDATDVVEVIDSSDVVDVTGPSEPYASCRALDRCVAVEYHFFHAHEPGQDSTYCLATRRGSDEKPGHSSTTSGQFVVVDANRRTKIVNSS